MLISVIQLSIQVLILDILDGFNCIDMLEMLSIAKPYGYSIFSVLDYLDSRFQHFNFSRDTFLQGFRNLFGFCLPPEIQDATHVVSSVVENQSHGSRNAGQNKSKDHQPRLSSIDLDL